MKTQTKSKKVNKSWLNDHVNDPYVKLAKSQGFRSRAAFKIKELDETLGLIRPGYVVVDLGSAPGAWSQYARRKLSPKDAFGGGGAAAGQLNGRILAVDLLPMEPVEGVDFILGDVTTDEVLNLMLQKLGLPAQDLSPELATRIETVPVVDVIISDMAPNLSGIASSDSARIAHLIEIAVEFAQRTLKPEGALVVKLFHGSGYSQLVKMFKERFRVVKPIKPKASRDKSSETFLVGIGIKPLK